MGRRASDFSIRTPQQPPCRRCPRASLIRHARSVRAERWEEHCLTDICPPDAAANLLGSDVIQWRPQPLGRVESDFSTCTPQQPPLQTVLVRAHDASRKMGGASCEVGGLLQTDFLFARLRRKPSLVRRLSMETSTNGTSRMWLFYRYATAAALPCLPSRAHTRRHTRWAVRAERWEERCHAHSCPPISAEHLPRSDGFR